jgi:hypothetical protein
VSVAAPQRRRLLGEDEVAELERAMRTAHELVAEFGRAVEFPELLMARALVTMCEMFAALRAEEHERNKRKIRQVVDVIDLTGLLEEARASVSLLTRRNTVLASEQEAAIELMLAMLERKKDRLVDHPEWMTELTRLSGASA